MTRIGMAIGVSIGISIHMRTAILRSWSSKTRSSMGGRVPVGRPRFECSAKRTSLRRSDLRSGCRLQSAYNRRIGRSHRCGRRRYTLRCGDRQILLSRALRILLQRLRGQLVERLLVLMCRVRVSKRRLYIVGGRGHIDSLRVLLSTLLPTSSLMVRRSRRSWVGGGHGVGTGHNGKGGRMSGAARMSRGGRLLVVGMLEWVLMLVLVAVMRVIGVLLVQLRVIGALIGLGIRIELRFVLFLESLLRICGLCTAKGRGDHIRRLHLSELTLQRRVPHHGARSADHVAHHVQRDLLCICIVISLRTTCHVPFFGSVGSGRHKVLMRRLVAHTHIVRVLLDDWTFALSGILSV